MIDLAILLTLAAVGFGIARWLRLPVVPVLMAMGIAMSWMGGRVGGGIDPELIRQTVELGLAFLLFTSGIELNPRRFQHQTRQVLWVSVVQFFLVGVAGYLAARLLAYDGVTAIYIAGTISASSTLVVLRQLKDRAQMYEPFGRLVTGVVLMQDLAMIVLVVVMAGVPGGVAGIGTGLGGLLVLLIAAVAGHRWIVPHAVKMLKPDDEVLLLIALAVLFGFLGLAQLVGAPLLAAAFLAGFALSAFPVNGLLRGLLGSLADFFQAIFFVALGLLVAVSDGTVFLHAAIFSVLILVITPPIVAAIAEWQGTSSRAGIESGLLLAQSSEFALVLGFSGLATGQISMETFSMIALVAVVTMTLTPFVATDRLAWRLLHVHPRWRRADTRGRMKGHVLMLGFGSTGMWVAKPFIESGRQLLVVDDDPVVIEQLGKMNIPCLRGDASDVKLLQRAGAKDADLIISALPRTADVLKILANRRHTPVLARTFEASDAAKIRKAGGLPVLNAEAAMTAFFEWFDQSLIPPGK